MLEQYKCAHGRRGFIYSILAGTLILLSLVMLSMLLEAGNPVSWKPMSANTLAWIGDSLAHDFSTLTRVSFSCGNASCTVTETLSDRNASRITLLEEQDMARGYDLIARNVSADLESFNSTGTIFLWSGQAAYESNLSSKTIILTGFLNYSYETGSVSCSLSEDCAEGSGKRVRINSGGCQYDALVSGACTLNLSYSGGTVSLNYSGTAMEVDYSGYAGEIEVNQTIGTNESMIESGPRATGDTSSTTNPGYAEPSYPGTFGQTKHYGTLSLQGATYYLITCDYQNDSTYEYYYLSNTTSFSGLKPHRTGSAMFLNNKVFVITVSTSGDSVTAHDVPGVRAEKTGQEIVRPL